MKPERFEKEIKEQLANRKIAPSADTWKRLEDQLDSSEEKSNRKNYAFWFAAAGFAAILVVALNFFENTETAPAIKLVEQHIEERTQEDHPAESEARNRLAGPGESRSEEGTTVFNEKAALPVINKKKSFIQVTGASTKSSEDPIENEVAIKPNVGLNKSLELEVEALLAEVKDLETLRDSVTDEEIERLLRRAQRDIVAAALLKNESSVVNASDLLFEVESKLDQSFRNRVFETLKEQFIKARAALAARN